MGAAAVPDAWIRNGQKRMNGSSCVKRSPEGLRKGAGGRGWLPAGYENPPYGMNRGGGGNVGMTRGLFATMPERADTKGSHWSKPVAPPLHSPSQSQRCPCPYRPENALSHFLLRERFQVDGVARRWQLLVGVRWQQWQCAVARSISVAFRCPCSSGVRAVVLLRFVRLSRGGSRWFGGGCVSAAGSVSRSPHPLPRQNATPPKI